MALITAQEARSLHRTKARILQDKVNVHLDKLDIVIRETTQSGETKVQFGVGVELFSGTEVFYLFKAQVEEAGYNIRVLDKNDEDSYWMFDISWTTI